MMRAVSVVSGAAYPLGRDDVDTDAILPGRFLKTITRTGLGAAAFEPIRAEPGNVFTDPRFAGSPILVAGHNFGCGSSREHAVWAMMDFGIHAVIATSFSDIFSGNAFKNGLLAIPVSPTEQAELLAAAITDPMVIDLPGQTIIFGKDRRLSFAIDPFRKQCLIDGLDEISLTLGFDDNIRVFETQRIDRNPWLDVG